MSKLRENYSKSLYGKIEAFVNGTEVSDLENSDADVEIIDSTEGEEKPLEDEIVYTVDESMDEQIYDKYYAKFLRGLYPLVAVIIALMIIWVLELAVSYLPEFGNPNNPVNNEVAARYIEHGMQETGTVNVVTGLILNYRGFDTMGETHVLFIAATTVMILLMLTKRGTIGDDYKYDREREPKNDIILKKVATFLIPVIAVFGIYVILNGHISPGGGFSGGSILGAGLILYAAAFGFEKGEKLFNEEIYKVAKVSALCCYVCTLSYYFYMGANGFDNHIPLGTPGAIISSGLILFIDIFVGIEVACTMYAFYALFRRGEI